MIFHNITVFLQYFWANKSRWAWDTYFKNIKKHCFSS